MKRLLSKLLKLLVQAFEAVIDRPIEENWREFWHSRSLLGWALAAVLGIAAAYATILFRLAIASVQWSWLGTFGEGTASAAAAMPWWLILGGPTVAGIIVGLGIKFLMPMGRTESVSDVIEAGALRAGHMPLKTGIYSAILTAISLGGGASAGREGPAVHLGATLSAYAVKKFKFNPEWGRILLACGVAGAVTASFNAPIAGVLFAHEIILGHYALRAFVPVSIASVAATSVARFHLGDFPAFTLPHYSLTSYFEFPAFALLGLLAAAVAITFMASVIYADKIARAIDVPTWIRPVIGGVIVGVIALFVPEVLGVGYEATDNALKQSYTLSFLIVLLVAKIVATAVTLASRFGGGIFSPSLYLGAMAGGAFGIIAAYAFPDMASAHGFYAVVGMGAVAAAVLGAPLSTTLIVFELTADYEVTIALLLANAIATALTQATIGKSFFHWQLEQRGVHLQEGPHRRVMMSIHVRDVMTRFDQAHPYSEDAPRLVNTSQDAVRLHPHDRLNRALDVMDAHGLDHLPVCETHEPEIAIGRVTRVAALKALADGLIAASREEHH
ncbi:MAG: chloride channel protein [Rhodobiaceae bacterium]|nr:MAG: chloride channel protein [Rhodobiaceae bacterium]